jgi:NarL family two-component system response regulator LiaR
MKEIRVLVVDDQTVVREGLVSILSFQSDIKVIGQANDGLEALAILKQEKPDVILLDLSMPRLDGFDSIPRFRNASPESKILILTGYAESERVFRAIQAGAIGYLLKDTTWEQLLDAIRNVAKGLPYMDPSIAIKVIKEMNKPVAPVKVNPATTLTDRETQTLRLIAKGYTNQEIARDLVVNERTIAKYVSNILNKLQLANRTQVALFAVKEGLDKE